MDFREGLWFGNRMEISLINPNQCRKFGIQIFNDMTDPQRNLGIEASEDQFIPITMDVSTCGLVAHPLTDDNLY